MLLPAVTINCKSHNNLTSRNQNSDTNTKVSPVNKQSSSKERKGQKINHVTIKNRTSKLSIRAANTNVSDKDAILHNAIPGISVANSKNNGNSDLKSTEFHTTKNLFINAKQSSSTFSSVRTISTCINSTAHENPMRPKEYNPKRFETDLSIRGYPNQSDYKEVFINNPEYKNRNSSSTSISNLPLRFSIQSSAPTLSRENHRPSSTYQCGNISRNDNSAFAIARKTLEQQNSSKVAPINFPPLRAPQSIVNVRHPLLTDVRKKHNETVDSAAKSKLNVMSSLQSGKDLEYGQQTFHGYGRSPLTGIHNMPNLSNVAANMSPYSRPDSFSQPTVANVLFSETAQFPQSPPFNTTQIGQLNRYQTYDTGSFATTTVNVNPVIPQFSAESSIPYPQYDSPSQFVQPNRYPTADITNRQYQYQTTGVSQIQDSSMFIQSLQSRIPVTDQYTAPNYTRAIRTELIPRLRRPPRFNK